MNYKQAYNGIIDIKENNQDILDSFFLPLVLGLHYQIGIGSEKDRIAGTTLINHNKKVILANLSNTTQIIFYGNKDPKVKFAADKIYVYLTNENNLIVEIPRFTSMYKEFNIKFDKTDSDQDNFEQLISLITYHEQANPNEKSMRSLQLDMDLTAFQDNKSDLLQLVMHIINKSLAEDDIGLIKFILNKINQNYDTQYTNTEIMNIIKDDYRRRKKANHQYRLVDVNNLQEEIDLKKQAKSEQVNIKPQDKITEENKPTPEEDKPKYTSKKDYFKNIFSGHSDSKSNENVSSKEQNNITLDNSNQNIKENNIQINNSEENNYTREKTDRNNSVQEKNDQEKTDQIKIKQNDSEQEKNEQNDSGQEKNEQNNFDQEKKGEDKHGENWYKQFF